MKFYIAAFFIAIGLLACKGSDGGHQFLGKWKDEKGRIIEISQNGSSFLVDIGKSFFNPKKNEVLVATLKDGTLQIENGFGGFRIAYVSAKDTLMGPDGEMSRAK